MVEAYGRNFGFPKMSADEQSEVCEIKAVAIRIIRDLELELFIAVNKKRHPRSYQKLALQAKILRRPVRKLENEL